MRVGIRFFLTMVCFLVVNLLISAFALGAPSCVTTYTPTRTVSMGTIDPYNYTNVVVPITMSIKCSGYNGPINYLHTIESGGSGNMNARTMSFGSNYVSYGICTTTSCTQQYGNGTAGTMDQSQSYTLSNTRTDSWILYFVVPVQPLSVPGVYNDTIGVTITVNW